MRRAYKIGVGIIALSLFLAIGGSWFQHRTKNVVEAWVEAPQWKLQYKLPKSAVDILMREDEWISQKQADPIANIEKTPPDRLWQTSEVWTQPNDYRPFRMTIATGQQRQTYSFFDPTKIYSSAGACYRSGNQLSQILQQTICELTKQASFGQIVPWVEVKKNFPKYTYAYITDLETQLRFKVQNRAGSNHADVQPASAADTAIMKQSYGGHWSWRRRAVVVEIAGENYAASMNGMPHGAGAIRGNKFDGHFCLHFLDSSTHVKSIDPSHQLMVWKASGHLPLLLGRLDQEALVVSLISVLNQQDLATLNLMLDRPLTIGESNRLKHIAAISLETYKPRVNGMYLEVKYYLEGERNPVRKEIVIPIVDIKGQGFKAKTNTFMRILRKI